MDTVGAQHQRWCLDASYPERKGDGEGRQRLPAYLPTAGTILGRTAWHIGTCICRSLCDDALHSWSFHRKGTCEMGIAGSYDSLDPALMGQELHGLYRLLPRLRTHVCEVPHGGFHPGDCRVHHPLTGHAGAEETA